MKSSIRTKIVVALALLIMGTIFLCWIANKTFMPEFYEHSKIKLLGTTFSEVNRIYNEAYETSEDAFSLGMEKISSNQNVSVYIFNLYYNYPLVFMDIKYPVSLDNMQQKQLESRVKEYYAGAEKSLNKNKELLTEKQQYQIYKIYDTRMESNYLELFGILENESTIYIRTNLESVQEIIELSNRFLSYVGLAATIIGMILMFLVCNNFTKPILELSKIAQKMSHLQFDVRYEVEHQDEIGILGESINTLSEKLEYTISELKSANNELKSDIEDKIQIDEMRKDFLSNVSHELKTPIALIQGYAEGLKDNVNEDIESREFYCEVIIDEAMKMNQMVKKLLSLNQIEFGSTQVSFERFDIVALIQSVLNSTEILFEQKKANLFFNEKEAIFVWADEYMIEEVVTNYISNALNHVEGEMKIEIILAKKDNSLKISIFNTGSNIPEEDLEKVWIKFYKVDKARTREYGGSGIGLSIVKAIMNSLNQQCGVKNYEDGVEFWFTLDTSDEV